jgi:hypothetical protein
VRICHFQKFREKFIKQLFQAHKNSPYFIDGMKYVENVLNGEFIGISEIAQSSVVSFFEMLGVKKKFLQVLISIICMRQMLIFMNEPNSNLWYKNLTYELIFIIGTTQIV